MSTTVSRTSAVVALLGLGLFMTRPAHATWAVVLGDSATGEVAIGQATCVSGIDLRSLSGVIVTEKGAATVQAFVDQTGLARTTIRDELLAGTPPVEILEILAATDPQHETHQYCIVSVKHPAATYTGTQAQELQFAGGQTGEIGTLRYCVAGNVLTGLPVIEQAVQALADTEGVLADRLMAAMEAARSMGGDGRCSCSPGDPTGCGSPPPSFDASAINGYLVLARTGDTPDCAICSGGDYYLDLNVAFQNSGAPDPVVRLQFLFDQFRANLVQRPDAVASVVTLAPEALLPDGSSSSTMEVLLLDLDGNPIGVPIRSFTVEHDPTSDGVSAIGTPVDNGGGSYTVTLTAGLDPGVDRFRITADDGMRPVILMPPPKLPIGVPGEVGGVRWSSPVVLEWDAALAAVSYHVYRGDLALLSCQFFGDCQDALDADPTDLMWIDPGLPLPGEAFFYLVTSQDANGTESVLGLSACGVRDNPDPCP